MMMLGFFFAISMVVSQAKMWSPCEHCTNWPTFNWKQTFKLGCCALFYSAIFLPWRMYLYIQPNPKHDKFYTTTKIRYFKHEYWFQGYCDHLRLLGNRCVCVFFLMIILNNKNADCRGMPESQIMAKQKPHHLQWRPAIDAGCFGENCLINFVNEAAFFSAFPEHKRVYYICLRSSNATHD